MRNFQQFLVGLWAVAGLIWLASSANAQLPVMLDAEVEIPTAASCWDMRHWVDDSTYGLAYCIGDTLFYKETLDSDLQYVVTDDEWFIPPGWVTPVGERTHVFFFKPQNQNRFGFLLTGEVYFLSCDIGDNTSDAYVLVEIDALSNSIERADYVTRFMTDGLFCSCSNGNTYGATLGEYRPWPEPPASAQYLSTIYNTTVFCDPAGDNSLTYSSQALVFRTNDTLPQFTSPAYTSSLAVLLDSESPCFAGGTYSLEEYGYHWDEEYFYIKNTRFWKSECGTNCPVVLSTPCSESTTYPPGHPNYVFCPPIYVGFGSLENGDIVLARTGFGLDFATLDTLWENPDAVPHYMARLPLDPNLAIAKQVSNTRFEFFRLIDGGYLDELTLPAGFIHDVITTESGLCSFISFTYSPTIVRAYVPIPNEQYVTICCMPFDGNLVELRWYNDIGATSYRIVFSEQCNENSVELTEYTAVNDTTVQIDVGALGDAGCFRIVPVYD